MPIIRTRRLARMLAACVILLSPLMVAAAPAGATTPGLEGIPRFDHIVVLPLENEDATTTFGPSSPAHYLNSLRARGTYLPQYYGTSHVSLGNYVTMISGLPANPSTISDCLGISLWTCVQTVTAEGSRHLGDQLDDVNQTWAGYMDGTVGDCFHAAYTQGDTAPDVYQGNSQTAPAYDYADRHNPWIYMANVVGNPTRCAAHEHAYTQLAEDIAGNRLPAFSFITPDTCHDGHDTPCSVKSPQSADRSAGGLTAADAWLAANLPPLVDYLENNNGLLVINFDEGNPATFGQETCATCAGAGAGGRTGALVLGAGVRRNATVSTGYDHASLLRTVEDSFGISEHLGLAGDPNAAPMTDVFAATPPASVPEVPLTVLLIGAGVAAVAVVVRRRRR